MKDARLRSALLCLHATLVERERREYEKAHGRTASGDFLQALLADPSLAWLSPLTSLVARLDELAEDAPAAQRSCRARVRAMLTGGGRDGFAERYAERLDHDPDLAFAHAAALHALRA